MKNERRKELTQQYKQTRAQMGVYAFRCTASGRVYLGASQNLGGTMNSTLFQLDHNAFPPNLRLLEEWNRYGRDGFSVDILEVRKYDKDESKTDYSGDLAVLKEFWREQLVSEGVTVENIKPKDR